MSRERSRCGAAIVGSLSLQIMLQRGQRVEAGMVLGVGAASEAVVEGVQPRMAKLDLWRARRLPAVTRE